MQFQLPRDFIKQGLRTLAFWIMSDDPQVCLGRDQALLLILANDGNDFAHFRHVYIEQNM